MTFHKDLEQVNVLQIFSYLGKSPKIHEDAIVSPLATIIGDVEISEGTAIFPSAVIRGDIAKITVGRYSNIQDGALLHGGDIYDGDDLVGHSPVEIGDFVTVGHGAVVHGSKIGNVSIIGIKAVVFGSVVGEGSIIGMNTLLLENSQIPPRSIAVGVPAKVVKKVDDTTHSRIQKHALWYNQLARNHKGDLF